MVSDPNFIFISYDISTGTYELQIGLVDPQSKKPRIKLAIEGIDRQGWYTMGNIGIEN